MAGWSSKSRKATRFPSDCKNQLTDAAIMKAYRGSMLRSSQLSSLPNISLPKPASAGSCLLTQPLTSDLFLSMLLIRALFAKNTNKPIELPPKAWIARIKLFFFAYHLLFHATILPTTLPKHWSGSAGWDLRLYCQSSAMSSSTPFPQGGGNKVAVPSWRRANRNQQLKNAVQRTTRHPADLISDISQFKQSGCF
jgi:hypothetical protein